MAKYNIVVEIDAPNEADAKVKGVVLGQISEKLTAKELVKAKAAIFKAFESPIKRAALMAYLS